MERGLRRALDYSDYLAVPEDGKRYEILAGKLHVTPAPRPIHQRLSRRLLVALAEYFHGRSAAEVFAAPCDLILSNHDIAQPDLLVVDDRSQITDRGIEGPPLLVVEILSDSTADLDRRVKALRYAEMGIPHYWIVDATARRLECHRLQGRHYALVVAVEADAHLTHPDFEGLTITLGLLWADSEAPLRG